MEATLNICNLKFLQQFCKILGLSPYGVKRDVVERLAAYLQQQVNVVPVSAPTITSEKPRRRCFGLFKNRKRQTNSLPNLTIPEEEEEEEDVDEYLLAEDHESSAAVAETATTTTTTPEAAAAATEEIPLLNEKKSMVNYLCYSNFPQFFFIYKPIHLFIFFSYFFSSLNALRYHSQC